MSQLSTTELELLKKLNVRAMVIVQLEDTLKEHKIPVDVNLLHQMETKDLVEMLENWSEENQEAARSKFLK